MQKRSLNAIDQEKRQPTNPNLQKGNIFTCLRFRDPVGATVDLLQRRLRPLPHPPPMGEGRSATIGLPPDAAPVPSHLGLPPHDMVPPRRRRPDRERMGKPRKLPCDGGSTESLLNVRPGSTDRGRHGLRGERRGFPVESIHDGERRGEQKRRRESGTCVE